MHDNLGLFKIEGKENIYVDHDGYFYSLTKENLKVIHRRNSSPAKFFRNNPFTLDNIKRYLSLENSKASLISISASSAIEKLELTCVVHGRFQKSWNELKNKQFCPKCGIIERSESKKNNILYVKNAFRKRGYSLLSEVYYSNDTLLEYICCRHPESVVQTITWGNFISEKGCKFCAKESARLKTSKKDTKFKDEIYEIFGHKIVIVSDYVNCKSKVIVHCKDCNIDFSSKAGHLLAGHLGCSCSSSSLGEDRISEYLNKHNISHSRQYRISNCRNKKPLPFDFAIFIDVDKQDLSLLVEFQGKQHYSDSFGWSSNQEKNVENFLRQKTNDELKRKYCIDNNIKLIEVPYWEINNVEEILSRHVYT